MRCFGLRITFFLLMAALLCNLGCQSQTVTEKAGENDLADQSSNLFRQSRPPSSLGAEDVQIRADVVSLAQGTYESLDADLRSQIEGGQPIQRETLDRFYAKSKAKLLVGPGILMKNKDFGSMSVGPKSKIPGYEFNFIPIIQSDGSLELYTFATISTWNGSPPQMVSLKDHRVVHPAVGSYEVYRGLKQGDDDVFMFIEIVTANTVQQMTDQNPT